jgi:DNA-binding beta-propeller fold protein YncE
METSETTADTAAISHSGSSAIVISAASQTATIYGSLLDAPKQLFSADLSTVQLPIVAAAVNDAGDAALVAASDGRNGSVYLLLSGVPPAEVAQTGLISAIRFLPDGGKAIAADRLWSNLLVIDSGASPQLRMLADISAGVDGPADLAVDESRGRIFVANAKGRTVAAISLAGQHLMSVDCPVEPARIAVLADGAMVSVLSADTGSVWSMQPADAQPVFSFLPSLD